MRVQVLCVCSSGATRETMKGLALDAESAAMAASGELRQRQPRNEDEYAGGRQEWGRELTRRRVAVDVRLGEGRGGEAVPMFSSGRGGDVHGEDDSGGPASDRGGVEDAEEEGTPFPWSAGPGVERGDGELAG